MADTRNKHLSQPASSDITEAPPSSRQGGSNNNNEAGNNKRFTVEIPTVSLPKGGAAIKGIDEKFEVNPVNGSASFSIPLPTGSARGFGAALSLSYNSGSGNGIAGLGWSFNIPSVKRKTDHELPQYFDEIDSDTYLYGGAEDLVPVLKEEAGSWSPVEEDSADGVYSIKLYRPRIERSFARIERWTNKSDGFIHWRVISGDNITSILGDTVASRIADPANPKKIFEWLLHFSYDDKGNCALYEYKQEDGVGLNASWLHNKNRINGNSPFTNSYLKRIRTGNRIPFNQGDPIPAQFMFETVLDYGEHDALNPPFNETGAWTFRADAFSDYRAGFEIRTCRLCERVLLYHHFAEFPGGSALVRSLNFTYDDNGQSGNFTFLKEIGSTGFTKHAIDVYTQKSLPPLSFTYQEHEWNKDVLTVTPENLANAPMGIHESGYQWVDLFSEGLNGMLSEQGTGLYYKHNLGNGTFSPARLISPKPSFGATGNELLLQELEADGTKYLTVYDGVNKGYFKIDDGDNWHPYKPFEQLPVVDFNDPYTRLVDLNGDGRPDILITEQNVFTWYPSVGEKGFEACRKVWNSFDEEQGPHIVFNDKEQSVFLADMNGDGLTDIVRIKNGSVCYWPNLGYGKFGAMVSMDNVHAFDHPELFDPSFLKLVDIDGSGTTDLLYLGKQTITIWLNQSGNSFSEQPETIDFFPEINNLVQVAVLDFLGNGTGCIVWSSPQGKDQERALRYINLMNSKKPHLLISWKNNMGKEVVLGYTASTQFYLWDKLQGNPWVTKLPFPVHCLNKVVTYDRIMKTRFASEYSYHHGYYDHAEKEFRGFGRVEQKDAEDINHFVKQSNGNANNVIEQNLHQSPVFTKTWFHTGAFLDQEKILNQFAHEYSQNTIHAENLLPEPALPDDMTVDEWRQALRACKGIMMRKEVYALDNTIFSDIPYTVEQQNAVIKMLQPHQDNKYACFLVNNSESILYSYERDYSDPRIAHSFVLETDAFGNVKKAASVVYARIAPQPGDPSHFDEQLKVYATYSENDFTNSVDTAGDYRTPLLFQTKLFELTGLPTAANEYYTLQEMTMACAAAIAIDYNVVADGSLQKRLVDWSRLQFREDDGITVLPFGSVQSKALLHQTYLAAFNQDQLSTIYSSKISLADLTAALLDPGKGGYIFSDNYFWVPSATPDYDVLIFFLATSFTDAFGNSTQVQYDSTYHMFVEKITDALGNEMKVAAFNYRVLQPYQMQDANDNFSAVRFDELGIVVKTFAIGKKGIDAGDAFDDTQVEISAGDFPSSELQYHLFEWFNQSTDPAFNISNYKPQPSFIKMRTRETHYHAHPTHQTLWQESYTWFGGDGQEVLKKIQAEPGEALQVNTDGTVTIIPDTSPDLRWVGNGRIIYNNKGNPVKQYEPYFSVSPTFDDEQEMVQLGVTPVIQYDSLARVIRTDFPNKTFTKIEFTSWLLKTFDANDTVRESQWYADRGSPDPLQPAPAQADQRAAWQAAKHHNTPTVAHLDTLGRSFLTIADKGELFLNAGEVSGDNEMTSKVILDIEGKELEILDALNRPVMQYEYDLLGRSLRQISLEAGTRWMLMDVDNNPILNWDEKDHTFSFEYDALRRLTQSLVQTGMEMPVVYITAEYGEALPVATAKTNNLRGVVNKQYDQSGITTNEQFDFKGNLLSGSLQFVADYKAMIDWATPGTVLLEPEVFTSNTEYDALNRPVKLITPHSVSMQPSEILPAYNEAGMLNGVDITIRGAATPTTFVSNVNYNAKGQREEIFYGNNTTTKYTYEKETFRLLRLLTTRNAGADILQDLNYIHDPAGNILQIKDNALPDLFFDGEQIQALNSYEYDALYRLVAATGRKQAGQTDIQPQVGLAGNSAFRNHPFINSITIDPNDAGAFRNYTEKYEYDKAGNMLSQQHIAKNSNWTRTFEYDNGNNLNNRLTSTAIGPDTYNYTYDAHGNMHGLETVLGEIWDFMDHFKEAALGGGGTAYYVYNGNGQRVRKVLERLNGTKQERIYLGGIEIYRERNNGGTITLERETLHVTDDQKRIAMVDTPVIKPVASTETELIRYQYDNHLGSASLELDDIAQVISYEEYFPYGATSYYTVDATREVPAKRYRYTGKERDEESGLNYHSARFYAPWLCRWTAADPKGIKDGLNIYIYVKDNPVLFYDPNGTDAMSDLMHELLRARINDPHGFANILRQTEGSIYKLLSKYGYKGCKVKDEDQLADFDNAYRSWAKETGDTYYPYVVAPLPDPNQVVAGALPDGTAYIGRRQDYERASRQQEWDYKMQVGNNIRGGLFGAVGYAIGGDEGSFVGAAGDALAMGVAGVRRPSSGAPKKSSGNVKKADPAPHVGTSKGGKDKPVGKAKATVNDAGADKCVGNVCAIMKNQELKAGPESGYTVKDIEREWSISFGRIRGGSNKLVATPEKSIQTISNITGLKVSNPKAPVNFGEAKAEGQYAIFFGESHVIYAKIGPGGKTSILDATVGRGWSSWKDFIEYAKKNTSLYGSSPDKANKAYRFEKK